MGRAKAGPRLHILAAGDAFGSGGLGQPAFLVDTGEFGFLLDCGPPALPGLKRAGFDPRDLDLILLSHLHGDHTGGVPFIFLEYQFKSRRQRPLTLMGPRGMEERIRRLYSAMYSEIPESGWRFEVDCIELEPGQAKSFRGLSILPVAVSHGEEGAALGFRIDAGGRVISYSGDTEWTEGLIELARGSDLFLCECYRYEDKLTGHLTYRELEENLKRLGCRRILLIHLHEDVLARREELALEIAREGEIIEI